MLHAVNTFFRVQVRNRLAIARYAHLALRRHVVGALQLFYTVKREGIATYRGAVANKHLDITLHLVSLDHHHADTKHRNAQMRQHHACQRTRNLAQTRRCLRPIHALRMHASPQVGGYRAHYPIGHDQAQRSHQSNFASQRASEDGASNRYRGSPAQTQGQGRQLGVSPTGQGTYTHEEHGRRHQRHKHRVKIRRAHRNFAHAQGVEHQGVERAQHHRQGRHH